MIYLIINKLIAYNSKFSDLKAFTYLSSRAILSLITSIIISMFIYPKAIRILRSLKAGQPIRELGLEEQMLKNESLQVADKLKVEEHLAVCYKKLTQGRELV